MGLLIICQNPECRHRNGEKSLEQAKGAGKRGDCLKCGQPLKPKKTGAKIYYGIEYRNDAGKLTRESNRKWDKKAADYRLNEIKNAKAEGGYIPQRPDTKTTFRDLTEWYLTLAAVKAKRSYVRDVRSVGKLNMFFGDCVLRDILPAMVEEYLHKRLSELSYRKHPTRPATVNRELACMNHIFTKAIRNGKAERNPVEGVKRPSENNKRDRVLSAEEYERLIAECPSYFEPVAKLAYYTGMRRGEILKLTWGMVDLKSQDKGINLTPEVCKTNEGRFVPLNPELVGMFKAMPHGLPLPGVPVFNREGKPFTGSTIRVGLRIACERAEIEGFTFHDFRHTFVTDCISAGIHDSVIMRITGHKSLAAYHRYITVNREQLKAAVGALGKPDVHQNVHQSGFGGR
ncbi:MAG: tyrosine-type recombinase/integrase [Desulfobaccales bacterium]